MIPLKLQCLVRRIGPFDKFFVRKVRLAEAQNDVVDYV